MTETHDHEDFDSTLLRAAMDQAANRGWRRLSLVDAARDAGLPPDAVRARFPMKTALLLRLGRMADESALRDDGSAGTLRERLFDLLMRRFDVLQHYREGVRAVLHALPYDPGLTAFLGLATLDTMRWMAEAAGVNTDGLGGIVRINALVGVWTHTLRAWERDDSPDLSATMAALDQALDRAERFGFLKASDHAASIDMPAHAGLADLPLEPEA
ncbi:TetR family transcriptional regulator [Tanticharoenia sakaeratensis]|uniref:TetR family transcriptional regulator n=1 Tax=Tanticharoenia sakaeratensis NBRC 103193 TaxID=1231623 RepID=A0A0D6MGU8_9PROT|nr:TetR family transcriptional regulator [Tanticharoenia sakaeratensis]GAN52837.1 TetR family transcriptional regulator [Tanticharoenia sakaeratensis NBRC 103193]GBQ18424.1 TetR family transcriptional regulator [Tanticharoenia sakaeratensis NBRC 103193]